MVSPTELPFVISFENVDGTTVIYHTANLEGVNINSDTEVDVRFLNNRQIRRSMVFQIINTNVTNGMVVQIYGCAETVFPSIPPDFTSGKYTSIPDSITTIPAQSNEAFSVSDSWHWILIRARRETAGQDATMSIYAHGEPLV